MAAEHDTRETGSVVGGISARPHRADDHSTGWDRRVRRTSLIGQVFLIGVAASITAQAIAAIVRWLRRPLAD